MDAQPLTIAVINTKGGVGKTSICHHIVAPFLNDQKRVLLVDLDYQANLSRGLYGSTHVDQLDHRRTSAALFDDSNYTPPEAVLHPTHIQNLTVLPGSERLEDFAMPKPDTLGSHQLCVRDFLDSLANQFDVILLDCHPSLDLTSWNALVAAEFVLCPFQPEDYGAQGISKIQRAIDKVVETSNRRLRLLGYVLNMVRKNSLHQMFENLLRDYYGDDVLETTIPQAVQMPEAIAKRLPVGLYKPRVKATKKIQALYEEMVQRVPQVRAAPPRYLYLGNQTNTDSNVNIPEIELGRAG
jgi:chromosome partitioning protein